MDIHQIHQKMLERGIPLASNDKIFNLVFLNDIVLEDILKKHLSSRLNRSLSINSMQKILVEQGIRIKNDDPVFILLSLNQIIIENSIAQCRKAMKDAENEKNRNKNWTEIEFENSIGNLILKIGERTLEACRDVLINGMDSAAAADKHQLFQSRINKIIIKLREAANCNSATK